MSVTKLILSCSLTLVATVMFLATPARAASATIDANEEMMLAIEANTFDGATTICMTDEKIDQSSGMSANVEKAQCDKAVKSTSAAMSEKNSRKIHLASMSSESSCSAKTASAASCSTAKTASAASCSASKAECSKSMQTASNAKVCPKTGKVIHQASYSSEKKATCCGAAKSASASSCDIDGKVIKNIETAALSGDFSSVQSCSVSKAALKKVTEATTDFNAHSKELVIEAVNSGDFSKVSACKTTCGEIERAVKQYAGCDVKPVVTIHR